MELLRSGIPHGIFGNDIRSPMAKKMLVKKTPKPEFSAAQLEEIRSLPRKDRKALVRKLKDQHYSPMF